MNEFLSLPQSDVYFRNDSHQIDKCEYEFVKANYDVEHTYGINSQEHVWDVYN